MIGNAEDYVRYDDNEKNVSSEENIEQQSKPSEELSDDHCGDMNTLENIGCDEGICTFLLVIRLLLEDIINIKTKTKL